MTAPLQGKWTLCSAINSLDLNFMLCFIRILLTSLIQKKTKKNKKNQPTKQQQQKNPKSQNKKNQKKILHSLVSFCILDLFPLQCPEASGSGMDFSWVGSNSFHCLVSSSSTWLCSWIFPPVGTVDLNVL